jgi:hypothetical protein
MHLLIVHTEFIATRYLFFFVFYYSNCFIYMNVCTKLLYFFSIFSLVSLNSNKCVYCVHILLPRHWSVSNSIPPLLVLKPLLHVQLYPPTTLLHIALTEQLFSFDKTHSLISISIKKNLLVAK